MKKAFTYNKEHMAKILGRAMPISTKYSIEICDFIRKKRLSRAKDMLTDVINLKRAVPIKKFKGNIPHKTKIGPGKYPKKASQEILKLLNGVEANAQFKGLNTAELVISRIVVNKAATQRHYGRKRRRQMKRTSVEIIVEEAKKSSKKSEKSLETKENLKKEIKKVEEAKVEEAKVEEAKGEKK